MGDQRLTSRQALAATSAFWRRREEWARLVRIMDRPALMAFAARVAPHLGEVIRSGTTASLFEVMAGVRCTFDVDGASIVLDGDMLAGAREIYARRVYEGLPGFVPGPDDVILDLGANVGVFTVLAAKRARRVIAVEAQALLMDRLKQVVADNGVADRVSAVQALVGGRTGVFADASSYAASHSADRAPRRLSLKEVLDEHGVERVDLMKADIEGSEYALFDTADEWLHRVHRIVMEVHPEHGDAEALAHKLQTSGFEVTRMDDDLKVLERFGSDPSYCYARRVA